MGKTAWDEEEALVMNDELRSAFRDVNDKVDEVLKEIAAVDKKLQLHLLESTVTKTRFEAHEKEHEEDRKWRWMLIAGVIVAIIGAAVAMAFRFIR